MEQGGILTDSRYLLFTVDVDSLEWRHNERDVVSNDRRLDGLLNRLLKRRTKKTSNLRVTGLWDGTPLFTGGFPSQRASNAENVSIRWRHHGEWKGCP